MRVSAPFHLRNNDLAQKAAAALMADMRRLGLRQPLQDLRVPVFGGADGADLARRSANGETDLLPQLAQMQLTVGVDWPAALLAAAGRAPLREEIAATAVGPPPATHVLAFGPSAASNCASMSERVLRGRGVQVVCASLRSLHSIRVDRSATAAAKAEAYAAPDRRGLQSVAAALSPATKPRYAVDWAAEFGPAVGGRLRGVRHAWHPATTPHGTDR